MSYPNLISYVEPPYIESRLLSGRKCDVYWDIVNSNVTPSQIYVNTYFKETVAWDGFFYHSNLSKTEYKDFE
jgi:hypothetical protein